MSGISTSVGLISGINITEIVDALIKAQRGTLNRYEQRAAGVAATKTGVQTLEANALSIDLAVQRLGLSSTFNSFRVDNSDTAQLAVQTTRDVEPGSYRLRAVREASRHEVLSRGYAGKTQAVGAGTITIATGGRLNRPMLLDALNAGDGVERSTIRITDRSGASADVDLSTALATQDVLDVINGAGIGVTASARGDHFVLTDTTGGAGTLSVSDLGGSAAADLGLAGSAAADVLTGSVVFSVFEGLTFDVLGDGNGPLFTAGGADLELTLADGTSLGVDLSETKTIGDVLAAINAHEDNNVDPEADDPDPKVTAELAGGRIVLTDHTTGAGTLSVADVHGAAALRALGLDTTASAGTLTGRSLSGGMNTALLRNLGGGAGVTAGVVELIDRSGTRVELDLSAAESLDEVITAINTATDGVTDLALVAELDDLGTGIRIRDVSGGAGPLTVGDLSGTLAADLGIAVNAAAVDTVESGPLALRYVNEATSLADYAPDGGGIGTGSFRITDSAGQEAVISITSTVKTVGDVITRINSASGIAVRAELNETGDGFVIVDEAGGTGTLTVTPQSGDVAEKLRLNGEAYTGGDGAARISSRRAAVIELEADDTLADLLEKLNAYSGTVTARLIDDGSAFNPLRLSLQSKRTGAASALVIDTGGLDLGLKIVSKAADALLQVDGVAGGKSLRASATNSFDDVFAGMDVDIRQAADTDAVVTVTRDVGRMQDSIQGFVNTFNTFVATAAELTKFEPSTGERGVLQGSALVLRVQQKLDGLLTRRFGSPDARRTLAEFGVHFTTGGKLTFDADLFGDLAAGDADAVADFFQGDDGFAKTAQSTLDSLTDPLSGTFTLETESLQNSLDTLDGRITELGSILEVRRVRLLQQFISMEQILSQLTAQQQALSAFRVQFPASDK